MKATKEKSYMLAIPKKEEELKDVELVMSRLKKAKDFTILNMGLTEDGFPLNEIEYKGETYEFQIYPEELKNNSMFMLTNEETAREKALAIERVRYMKTAFLNGAKVVLVKVGLMIDDEYKTETNQREHIWFELKSVDSDTFTAELTQEPYMVSGIYAGAIGTYSYNDITDWIVYTEEERITPDDVYLWVSGYTMEK